MTPGIILSFVSIFIAGLAAGLFIESKSHGPLVEEIEHLEDELEALNEQLHR